MKAPISRNVVANNMPGKGHGITRLVKESKHGKGHQPKKKRNRK